MGRSPRPETQERMRKVEAMIAHGMKNKDIAAALGISTVMAAVDRSRLKLKRPPYKRTNHNRLGRLDREIAFLRSRLVTLQADRALVLESLGLQDAK
jgi:predicted transcriptional regulator